MAAFSSTARSGPSCTVDKRPTTTGGQGGTHATSYAFEDNHRRGQLGSGSCHPLRFGDLIAELQPPWLHSNQPFPPRPHPRTARRAGQSSACASPSAPSLLREHETHPPRRPPRTPRSAQCPGPGPGPATADHSPAAPAGPQPHPKEPICPPRPTASGSPGEPPPPRSSLRRPTREGGAESTVCLAVLTATAALIEAQSFADWLPHLTTVFFDRRDPGSSPSRPSNRGTAVPTGRFGLRAGHRIQRFACIRRATLHSDRQ